jgi:hypothetical protein
MSWDTKNEGSGWGSQGTQQQQNQGGWGNNQPQQQQNQGGWGDSNANQNAWNQAPHFDKFVPVPNAVYKIISALDKNKCLEYSENNSTLNRVQISTYKALKNQVFKIIQ